MKFKIFILAAVFSVTSAQTKKPTVTSVHFDEDPEDTEINTAPYNFPHTPQRSNPYYNQNPIRLYRPQNYHHMQAHPSRIPNHYHSQYNPGYDHPMFAEPPPNRWGAPYPPPIEESDTGMTYWIPKQEKRYITVPKKSSKPAIKTPIAHVEHQNHVSTVKPTTTTTISSNTNVEDTKDISVQTTTEAITTSAPVINASSTEIPEQQSEELENVKLRHHLQNEHNCVGYGEDHKEESKENTTNNETTSVSENVVQETTVKIIIEETSPVSINEDTNALNENIIEVVVPSGEAAVVENIVVQPNFRRTAVLPPDFEDLSLYGHNYEPPPSSLSYLRRSYPYAYPRLPAPMYSGEPGQQEMYRRNLWNPTPQFVPTWPKQKHHVAGRYV